VLNLLNGTTDKIQVVTSAAAAVDVVASWADLNGGAVTPGRTCTAISTAATTDVVATPAASTTRNVRMMTIRNRDAAVQTDVTVLYNAGGTTYQLAKRTLNAGDELVYIEGVGFRTITGLSKFIATLMCTADVVEAASAFKDITGLTWPVKAGRHYVFEAQLIYQTNATTTGAQFGINGPASPSLLKIGSINTVTPSATAAVVAEGTAAAYDTAVPAQTTGPGTTDVMGTLAGAIIPSVDGQVALRMKSEVAVAAGLTVRAGSWVEVREADN
jgi:hypothetical protein